jgi:hypothetical protein
LEKYIKFIISDNNMNLMIKAFIKFIDIDNNKESLNMDMKFEYFELRLHNQMKISEIDRLLEVVDLIEE